MKMDHRKKGWALAFALLVVGLLGGAGARAQTLSQELDLARPALADGGLYERMANSSVRDQNNHQLSVFVAQRDMLDEIARMDQEEGILSRAKFTALENYALSLRAENDLEDAAAAFEQLLGLQRIRLEETDRAILITLNDLARVLDELGRDQEAEELYLELIGLTRKAHTGDHPDNAAALTNYARFLHGQGRPAEALPLQEEALRINRATLDPSSRTGLPAINNYGVMLLDLGRPAEADRHLSEALARYGESEEPWDRARITLAVNSARAQLALGRREEAVATIENTLLAALPKWEGRLALPQGDLTALSGLSLYAGALAELDRRDEAAEIYLGLLAHAQAHLGNDHSQTLALERAYAEFHLRAGDGMRAGFSSRALVRRLRARARGLAEAGLRGATQRERETAGVRASERFHADALWELFNTYKEQVGETPDLTGAEREAARGRLDREFTPEALDALMRATANPTSSAVGEAAALRFASQQGFAGLARERQALVESFTALEAAMVRGQAGGGQRSGTLEKARARLAEIEERIKAIDADLAQNAPQFLAILNQDLLSVFGLQMSDESGSRSEVLNQNGLSGDRRVCAREFTERFGPEPLRLQELRLCLLRSVLDAEEALLFLVPGPFGTHSLALSRDGVRWARSGSNREAISGTVEDFRVGIEIQAGDASLPLFDLALAHQLYSDLVAPVEEALAGKSRVYVVADGALSRLPLGTLLARPVPPDADPDDPATLRGAPWLADRYALVQLPSVQSLVYIRTFGLADAAASDGGFAGFGAPLLDGAARLRGARSATLDALDASDLVSRLRGSTGAPLMNPDALRGLAALPGTKGELEEVRKALGAPEEAVFLGERMTETSIRTADLSATRILHLATHGFTSEESGAAAEPGLVFTPPEQPDPRDDGYLAASEVVGLDLALAHWVILSACNTASPSGRPGETGLSGLAQAFFYAGAQSLLVSHWPVFDDIAPRLTVEALKRSQAGEPRAEALQAAMRRIREDPALEAAHPAVWAPFALVGEGR